jgi:hypothetical protein
MEWVWIVCAKNHSWMTVVCFFLSDLTIEWQWRRIPTDFDSWMTVGFGHFPIVIQLSSKLTKSRIGMTMEFLLPKSKATACIPQQSSTWCTLPGTPTPCLKLTMHLHLIQPSYSPIPISLLFLHFLSPPTLVWHHQFLLITIFSFQVRKSLIPSICFCPIGQ